MGYQKLRKYFQVYESSVCSSEIWCPKYARTFLKKNNSKSNKEVLLKWPPYFECGMSEATFNKIHDKVRNRLARISQQTRSGHPTKFLLMLALSYLKHYNRLEKISFDYGLTVSTCTRLIYRVLLALACSEVVAVLPFSTDSGCTFQIGIKSQKFTKSWVALIAVPIQRTGCGENRICGIGTTKR
jgi:hypothetical protein